VRTIRVAQKASKCLKCESTQSVLHNWKPASLEWRSKVTLDSYFNCWGVCCSDYVFNRVKCTNLSKLTLSVPLCIEHRVEVCIFFLVANDLNWSTGHWDFSFTCWLFVFFIFIRLTDWLIPWSRLLLEKLIIVHGGQEIARLPLNPKVHYRIHKNSPLIPVLREMSPVNTLTPQFSKIRFNMIFHVDSSFQVFRLKCTHFSHACYIPSPPHPQFGDPNIVSIIKI